ncbi:MAG: DUF3108 domain-containing protein [Desulfobaccales bacterium]
MSLLLPSLSPAGRATPAPTPQVSKVLEELNYKVDVWLWPEAIKAKMVFREVAPNRYQAELKGTTQGLFSLLTSNWQGSLSTEMEYVEGKLRPLVYREASQKGDKKKLMEYRFDYNRNKVELYKQEKKQPLAKRWETTLKGPMYDPLTFFYNRRLAGAGLGTQGGENLKFQGIPYPKPDEITLRVGDQTPEGRKIMVELGNRIFKGERSQVFAYLDADGIPTKAWTQVKIGKVHITLLPGGRRLKKEALTEPAGPIRALAN